MSFIFSTRLASFWRHASTRMPCLVRRVDPLFHPPPCLDSSFLPFLLRLICLSSSFLSCLSSSALPRFHLPSPTPDRLSSISPLHVGGSGRLAKQTARTSRWFDWSVIKTLVSCTVCLNHCLEQAQMKYLRINYIHSIKRETVETIQIFYKIIVYGRSPVYTHPRQLSARWATTLPNPRSLRFPVVMSLFGLLPSGDLPGGINGYFIRHVRTNYPTILVWSYDKL